ncbi:non-histone chromosomal protein HMG-like isoform X2 [Brachionichthys hirsutus]|uniref:non-histone chromosomal protein HMG-like isoform X2 n=1 Tax=Brachionichthys hirsutus TaxID=412623 RepID=UPI0036053BC4
MPKRNAGPPEPEKPTRRSNRLREKPTLSKPEAKPKPKKVIAKPKKGKEVAKAKPEETAPEAPAENGEAKAENDAPATGGAEQQDEAAE